jgi:hypothetical protein
LGVIGAIVGGGFFLRSYLSGNASELQVGDCFDEPANAAKVEDVQHHPCTESHSSEVILVADHPDASTYPGLDAFDSFVFDRCVPAYESYTGHDYETDTELDIGYFYPLSENWPGDKEVTCYVFRLDSAKMTSSVKAASN